MPVADILSFPLPLVFRLISTSLFALQHFLQQHSILSVTMASFAGSSCTNSTSPSMTTTPSSESLNRGGRMHCNPNDDSHPATQAVRWDDHPHPKSRPLRTIHHAQHHHRSLPHQRFPSTKWRCRLWPGAGPPSFHSFATSTPSKRTATRTTHLPTSSDSPGTGAEYKSQAGLSGGKDESILAKARHDTSSLFARVYRCRPGSVEQKQGSGCVRNTNEAK